MSIAASASTELQRGWNLFVAFEETGTSVQNNTSTINCSARLAPASSAYMFDYYGAGTLAVYWHDNRTNTDTLVASAGVQTATSSNNPTVSGSITVTHNNDGTLSGYARAYWTKSYNSGYIPASGGVNTAWTALTTIARKSVPTLSSSSISLPASSGTLTVNTNRASSSFTHKITLKVGNTTITTTNNVGASTTYQLTSIQNAILATIPNATSATLTVYCETFSGSTSIGTNSVNCAVSVNSNAAPTFSNFTYADTNSTTTAITGNNQILISGKSTLTATISAANKATANYSATMSSYSFTINAQTATQAYSTSDITKNLGAVTLGNVTNNQAKDLVVAAIDSRGLNKKVTKTITVLAYNNPVINATATRANGFENNTTIAVSGNVSPLLVNGTGKNSVNTTSGLQYRYKAQSTTTWGAWTNIACTYNSTTGAVSSTNFVLNLDNQTAYDFEFRLTDRLATTTASLAVSQGQPAFFIGDDRRVSVGGMPTEAKLSGKQGQLEVNGTTFVKSNTGDTGMEVRRTDVSRSQLFGIGSGGTNAGIYDRNANAWIIYDDKTKTYLPRFQAATSNIADGAVTNAKIANNTIAYGKLNAGSVNAEELIYDYKLTANANNTNVDVPINLTTYKKIVIECEYEPRSTSRAWKSATALNSSNATQNTVQVGYEYNPSWATIYRSGTQVIAWGAETNCPVMVKIEIKSAGTSNAPNFDAVGYGGNETVGQVWSQRLSGKISAASNTIAKIRIPLATPKAGAWVRAYGVRR